MSLWFVVEPTHLKNMIIKTGIFGMNKKILWVATTQVINGVMSFGPPFNRQKYMGN